MPEQMDKRNLQHQGARAQVIVVVGPQGCGKTRNRDAICRSLTDREYLLIDGHTVAHACSSIEHNLRYNGPKTFIVMTNENVKFDMFLRVADDVRVLSFNAVRALVHEGDIK